MCRFVLYMGPEIKMSTLVTDPAHSIIVQSYHSEERKEPLNGDGFGVAWYPQDDDPIPAVFKSVSPAWSNQNLINLSRVIHSNCFLAHVRAASPDLPVSRMNCHPFSWRRFAFMHNGAIKRYNSINRKLRGSLSDSSYAAIKGTTDSEAIFAMFVDKYSANQAPDSAEKMAVALEKTIASIEELQKSVGCNAGCDLNLAVSNGEAAVVSRYSTLGREPNSLHIHTGHSYHCGGDEAILLPCTEPTVLVSSEPLTADASWRTIEANHIVVVNELLDVDIRPIKLH